MTRACCPQETGSDDGVANGSARLLNPDQQFTRRLRARIIVAEELLANSNGFGDQSPAFLTRIGAIGQRTGKFQPGRCCPWMRGVGDIRERGQCGAQLLFGTGGVAAVAQCQSEIVVRLRRGFTILTGALAGERQCLAIEIYSLTVS